MKHAKWERIWSRFHLQDKNLRWIMISIFPASVAGWMVRTVLPLYVRGMGVGMLGVGAVFTIFAIFETVFAVPAGWVADRYNRARVIVFSTAIAFLGYLILLAPGSLALLILFGLIYWLSIDMAYTSRYSLTLDIVPEEKRGAVFGLYFTLTFLLPIGAGLMLGILLDLGFRAVFAACALLMLIALLLRLRIRDTRREAVSLRPGMQVQDNPRGSQPDVTHENLILRMKSLFRSFLSDMGTSWSVFIQKSDLLAVVMIGVLCSVAFGVSMSYFIIHFTEILRFDFLAVGALFSLLAAGFALAGILGGLLADRLGRWPVLVISALVSGALTVAFVFVQRFDVMAAVFFLLALVGGVWSPVYQVILGELTPERHRGRVFSVMDVFTTGGMAVGPLLGGWLWIALGPASVFITDAMIRILCGILLVFLFGSRDRERQHA